MKVLGLILLIVAAGQINGQQRSEFTEYLLQLDYITNGVHQYLMDIFAQTRAMLSEELTGLNDEGVHEITEGLRVVIAIRDQTEEVIAEATTPEREECIATATADWSSHLETTGINIGNCADEHIDPIYTQTEQLHLYLQQHNRMAFNVQNMVLGVFTDLNPLTQADEITPRVEAEIDVVFEEMEGTIRPEIVRRLAAIQELRRNVPTDIQTCVAESVQTFEDQAVAISVAVAHCVVDEIQLR